MMLMLAGCGEKDPATTETEPFEIEGSWLYLGPSDGPHTLTISRTSMVYKDIGSTWTSTWNIKKHDNALHHFQVAFASGSGSYLPVGQNMSGAYDKGETLLTVQLASGDTYPQLQGPGTCTAASGGSPLPECRLYVKQ